MSDDAYGATIAKRRLARYLTAARLRSGYTANHACDILNWGRGKVGRFEANQWKRPEMSDIRDLIRIYGIEGEEKDEIEELAIKARSRPWWREYPEIFDSEFPGYENDATTIRVFMPLVLPGLLQTPAYTEALMRAGPRPPAFRRRALESRHRRQAVLDRTDGSAPMFSAVITEASLLYRWGMREDRREQVEHLVELSKHRNVQLHVQRLSPRTLGATSNVSRSEWSGDDRPVSGDLAEGPPQCPQRGLCRDRSQLGRRDRRPGQQAARRRRARRRPGCFRRVSGRREGRPLRLAVTNNGKGPPVDAATGGPFR